MHVINKLAALWDKFGNYLYSLHISTMPEKCRYCQWRIETHCPLQQDKKLTEDCIER